MMTHKTLFCNVIRACLIPERYALPDIQSAQMRKLHEILSAHTLTALPGSRLFSPEMPPELREDWERELYAQKRRFGQHLLAQNALLRQFAEAGIPCAIMKGTVSASYYPEPACRAMGDIDLLVLPRDRDRAAALLRAGGFEQRGFQDSVEQRFEKGATVLELHTGITACGPFSDRINAYLLGHFGQLQTREQYGFPFPCLPECCNGLLMLEHMRHHLRDQLGFRQVIDWMLYVDSNLDDGVWHSQMRELCAACGLETFAVVITAMCQQFFGLRTEGISWPQGANTALCQELFDHIYAMGNFGRELGANHKSVAGLLREGTLPQMLGRLQKAGLQNWALCRRNRWLRPFAWLYQSWAYVRCVLTRNYNLSFLLVLRERRRVRKAQALMGRLGLGQDEVNFGNQGVS